MLRITVQNDVDSTTLRLEGSLAGEWVREVENCWVALRGRGRKLVADLQGVTFVDGSGKQLLSALHRDGVKLAARGCMMRALVQEIAAATEDIHSHASGRKKVFSLVLIFVFMLSHGRALAEEKPVLRLTLREAIQLALKRNPQVQIANLNLAQSEEDRSIARAALLPEAGFQAFEQVRKFNLDAFTGRGGGAGVLAGGGLADHESRRALADCRRGCDQLRLTVPHGQLQPRH